MCTGYLVEAGAQNPRPGVNTFCTKPLNLGEVLELADSYSAPERGMTNGGAGFRVGMMQSCAGVRRTTCPR